MDVSSLYHKIANYCAYQERSLKEVQAKLTAWEVPSQLHSTLINLLMEEGYLNQARFASTYVRGKVHLKKWGKVKVKMHLQQKGIDENTIEESLNQIDEDAYLENAKKIALIKFRSLKSTETPLSAKQKIYRTLLSKGFEADVIKKAVEGVFKDLKSDE